MSTMRTTCDAGVQKYAYTLAYNIYIYTYNFLIYAIHIGKLATNGDVGVCTPLSVFRDKIRFRVFRRSVINAVLLYRRDRAIKNLLFLSLIYFPLIVRQIFKIRFKKRKYLERAICFRRKNNYNTISNMFRKCLFLRNGFTML